MRITTVKHAQKPQTCGKCGDKIKPSRDEKQEVVDKRSGKKRKKVVRVLGDGYRWIKFNRGPRLVRCMKAECRFRNSDLTRSDKLARVYGAQEDAETGISAWYGEEGVESLRDILNALAETVREVAQEYGDSADNMEQAFTGGSPQIDEIREKQEGLESWADEIESADLDEWDGEAVDDAVEDDRDGDEVEDNKEGEEPKNSSNQTLDEWAEEQRDKASEAVMACPL